ncbi:MAG: glycosyltransferase family 9 protein [Deltaproteobacteria bacterium]
MPDRFLLIRLSAIGDVINTLPALTLLRRARPEARISFVVEDRAAELLIGHPCIDHVYVFERCRFRELLRAGPRAWGTLRREFRAYAAEIRAGAPDVTLDFQGNLKGAFHAAFSGASRRIAFAQGHSLEGSRFFATETVVPPPLSPHRVDKFCSLLGPLGIDSQEREYILPHSAAAVARAAACREASGCDQGRFVVLHPGTSDKGADKRWPAERFGALAARIEAEAECRVLVTWGPGEEGLAREVLRAAKGAAVLGPQPTSLLDLAALIESAAVFVSADTGPMHLAAAKGVRCVALFGPKDPAIYRPYGRDHRVLRAAATGGAAAMTEIGVAEVFAEVEAALQAGAAAQPAG